MTMAGLVLGSLVAGVFLPVGARLVGGEGSSEDLAWSVILSFAPHLLWTPLALLGQMTPAAALWYWLLVFGLSGWTLWIQVAALGVCFRLGALRALFAALLGYGLAAVLFVAFALFDVFRFFHTLALWTN